MSARQQVPGGPVFWTAVAVGWAVIAFGVVGALVDARFTHPTSMATWMVGALLVHDLVLAPLVFGVGRLLRRGATGTGRTLLQAVLVLFGALVVVSIPVLGRFGTRPDNDTLLPRDYAVGLIVALLVVWAATTAVMSVVARRR